MVWWLTLWWTMIEDSYKLVSYCVQCGYKREEKYTHFVFTAYFCHIYKQLGLTSLCIIYMMLQNNECVEVVYQRLQSTDLIITKPKPLIRNYSPNGIMVCTDSQIIVYLCKKKCKTSQFTLFSKSTYSQQIAMQCENPTLQITVVHGGSMSSRVWHLVIVCISLLFITCIYGNHVCNMFHHWDILMATT